MYCKKHHGKYSYVSCSHLQVFKINMERSSKVFRMIEVDKSFLRLSWEELFLFHALELDFGVIKKWAWWNKPQIFINASGAYCQLYNLNMLSLYIRKYLAFDWLILLLRLNINYNYHYPRSSMAWHDWFNFLDCQ